MSQEFHAFSADVLTSGLRSGKWTSVELTTYFLDRIKKIDPGIHSVPFLFEKEALEQARASDQRQAIGSTLSSLDGLPMTIKDAIRIKNNTSTYGLWALKKYRPKSDSKLIEILRKSGVVFLGRTAVPTAAFDWNCWNRVYTECVNPFDATRTPGGSSGGAAAALAMGLTPLELGSDLGGSIRYPAHCCGIYGLRTTDGWLPISDIGPEGFTGGFKQLVTFGPMARNVGDLDLMLSIFEMEFPLKKFGNSFPQGNTLKIGYSLEILKMHPEPSTRKALEHYLDRLTQKGHRVVEAHPKLDFEELYRIWGIIAGYEYSEFIPKLIRNDLVKKLQAWWMLDHRIGSGPFTTYFKKGMLAKSKEYMEACEARIAIFKTLDKFFYEYSLWILPVAPSSAIPRIMCGKDIKTPEGMTTYSRYLGSYTVPTAAMGTPVLTCPIGVDESGMPIGVQIHGPRFSDRWLVETVKHF